MIEFGRGEIATNGVTLNVHSSGVGPAVVLMHGWCGSAHSWRKLAPLLARDHLVIVPDMRGYGRSTKPEDGYDAASGADDMVGLLDHFGVERAHMVGHDMGAPVALVFGGRHPERTLTVTYIDEPLLGFDTERYTAFTEWNHGGYWQFGMHNTPGLPEIVYPGREEAFLKLLFSHMTMVKDAVTDEDVAVHASGMKVQDGIRGMTGWYRAAGKTGEQIRALAESGSVTVPTLAVRGEGGVAGILEEIKQAVPHATGVMIAGSGHLVPEEKPSDLEGVLRDHFARVSG